MDPRVLFYIATMSRPAGVPCPACLADELHEKGVAESDPNCGLCNGWGTVSARDEVKYLEARQAAADSP